MSGYLYNFRFYIGSNLINKIFDSTDRFGLNKILFPDDGNNKN